MQPLFLKDLQNLVGKTIKFTYSVYELNEPVVGIIETIQGIDLKEKSPITKAIAQGDEYSHLQHAFVETYTIIPIGADEWKLDEVKDGNNCLSIGDSGREVFFEIVE